MNEDCCGEPFHIYDDVHGYIEICTRRKQIIDTPQFQRLRYLKQLGASYFVHPGATHNRFEHSIGVSFLAGKFLRVLQSKQLELKITEDEIFCVEVAGLLHDIGHGPFSHTFDRKVAPRIIQQRNSCLNSSENSGQMATLKKYRHEDMSVRMIDFLFEENCIQIESRELQFIQALISPSTHSLIVEEYAKNERAFLFEIVSNDINGIDVQFELDFYKNLLFCKHMKHKKGG